MLALFIAQRYHGTKQSGAFIRLINYFAVLGLSLGVMALITVMSVMNGLQGQLKERLVTLLPHIQVHAAPSSLPPIKHAVAAPYLATTGLLQSADQLHFVQLQSLDADSLSRLPILYKERIYGDWQQVVAQPYQLAISRFLAQKLNFQAGDKLRLIIPSRTRITPLGPLPIQKLVSIAVIFDLQSSLDEQTIFISLPSLQSLLGKNQNETRLFLDNPYKLTDTASLLTAKGMSITTWQDRQVNLLNAVKMEKNIMSVLLLLVIAVAAFNIIAALFMVVTEKKHDIAILQTLGFTPRRIYFVFVINGMLTGLKGLLFGLALGLALTYSLNPLLATLNIPLALAMNGQALPFIVDVQQISGVLLIGLLICICASVWPARQALKVNPVDNLKTE